MGSIEWMNTGELACKRLGTECAERESQNKDNLLLWLPSEMFSQGCRGLKIDRQMDRYHS